MKKYISIERKHIATNLTLPIEKHLPVICVEYEDGRPEEHYNRVDILGPSVVVYKPFDHDEGDPSSSAWIETDSEIKTW